jgi:hypothetical protein
VTETVSRHMLMVAVQVSFQPTVEISKFSTYSQ